MATMVDLIVTPEDGQASHYRLHVASEALARTVVNQVRVLLANNQVVREKRLAEVYKTLIDLSDPYSGECDCYQDELATKVGLSVRHVRRMIVELEAMGLVVVQQTARGRKTKNTYLLPNLTTALELLNNQAMPAAQSDEILSGFSLESRKLMSAMIPGADMSGMNHDDHDDENHDMHDSSTRRTLSKRGSKTDLHLLFLHEGERRNRLRQRHCTAAYLKAWDDWWAAGQFQGFTNPAGWANLQIKKGFWPPTITPRLPHIDNAFPTPSDIVETGSQEFVDPHEKLWAEILACLRPQMTRATYDTILKDTRLKQRKGTKFIVCVGNTFARGWLENRLASVVKRAIASVVSEDMAKIDLEFVMA